MYYRPDDVPSNFATATAVTSYYCSPEASANKPYGFYVDANSKPMEGLDEDLNSTTLTGAKSMIDRVFGLLQLRQRIKFPPSTRLPRLQKERFALERQRIQQEEELEVKRKQQQQQKEEFEAKRKQQEEELEVKRLQIEAAMKQLEAAKQIEADRKRN